MSKKMVQCKYCQHEIAANAKTCPNCGAKNKKPIFKRWWFWLVIIVAIAAIAGNSKKGSKDTSPDLASQTSNSSSADKITEDKDGTSSELTTSDASDAEDPLPDPAEQAADSDPVDESAEPADNVPSEYKSAQRGSGAGDRTDCDIVR